LGRSDLFQRARILAFVTGLVNQQLLLRTNTWRPRITSSEPTCHPGSGCQIPSDPPWPIAKRLGRKALKDIACVARPDTILAWYRRLVAAEVRRVPRSWLSCPSSNLAAGGGARRRFARQNRGWGYDRIVGALANLDYTVSDQTVRNVLRRHGIAPAPQRGRTPSEV
jgi:putative transposase